MIMYILKHPNTPAYLQAAAIAFAAWWGGRKVVDYFCQRRADKEFEIASKAFIGCNKAYSILMGIKSSHIFDRAALDDMLKLPKQLAELYLSYANNGLELLGEHDTFFDVELHTAYSETTLFFDSKTAAPLHRFLNMRGRLSILFQAMRSACNYVIANADHYETVGHAIDKNIEIIEDVIVQVWEDVELSKRQEKKEIDEGKGYQLMGQALNEAMDSATDIFPKIVRKA